jgi:hypothetical protein
MKERGSFELQMIRAADGTSSGRFEASRPDACFSPDGLELVFTGPGAELLRTTPDGDAPRPLGHRGRCAGFSPDGRYLLLGGEGGGPFRLVTVASGSTRTLDGALDARFLPPKRGRLGGPSK